ncbi:hypothetical protein THTE_0248 [Thermogutta terrifontis]|uniref:Uncharacterized protein n=1 Tax=Thermogutta terrifontis TaxID=1331910 RepID=A0A286RA73_9BACT|nr:hypothetical protein THTE_0248 [Thermogutta terrifontis]
MSYRFGEFQGTSRAHSDFLSGQKDGLPVFFTLLRKRE